MEEKKRYEERGRKYNISFIVDSLGSRSADIAQMPTNSAMVLTAAGAGTHRMLAVVEMGALVMDRYTAVAVVGMALAGEGDTFASHKVHIAELTPMLVSAVRIAAVGWPGEEAEGAEAR